MRTFTLIIMYRKLFKRGIDLVASLILLLLLSPVFLLVGLALAIVNRGSPLFIQERPGWKERPFRLIKFKTMTDQRGPDGNLLPDRERTTRLGGWVRKASLDELPQLIDVLSGNMSLIGPRPLLFKYIPLYSDQQRRRHEVRPGITGWAQVNGRNSIPWKEKFALDVYYVDNLSFALDMRILWITLIKVLRREGINQSEERPMPPFTGNN